MVKITAKQQRILDFITESKKKNGYAPTVREICEHVGLSSTSTVHGYIDRLVSKGLLVREERSPRTLRDMKVNHPSPAERIIEVMKNLDDDLTDIIKLEGEFFVVKRATPEEIKEFYQEPINQ